MSLLNTGYKIYSKIIAKRLTVIAEVLLEEQIEFRKGRCCMDCIFSALQISDIDNTVQHTKCYGNETGYTLLI